MRRIKVFILTLSLLFVWQLSAQTEEEQIERYLYYFNNSEYEKALEYEKLVFSIAEQDMPKNTTYLDVLFNLAFANFSIGRYEQSINYLEYILPTAKKHRLIYGDGLSNILFYLGTSYKVSSNYNKAIYYYDDLKNHLESIQNKDLNLFSVTFSELAFCYQMIDDFETSKEFYEIAIEAYKLNKNEEEIISIYDLYGRLLIEHNEYEQGIFYTAKALDFYSKNLSGNFETLRVVHQKYVTASIKLEKNKNYRIWILSFANRFNKEHLNQEQFFLLLDDLHYLSLNSDRNDWILLALEQKLNFIKGFSKKGVNEKDKKFAESLIETYPQLCISGSINSPLIDQKIEYLNRGIKWFEKNKLHIDTVYFELHEQITTHFIESSDFSAAKKSLKKLDNILFKKFPINNVFILRNELLNQSFQKEFYDDYQIDKSKEILSMALKNNDLINDSQIFWGAKNLLHEIKTYYFDHKEIDSLVHYALIEVEYLESFKHVIDLYLSEEEIAELIFASYSYALMSISENFEKYKSQYLELLNKQQKILKQHNFTNSKLQTNIYQVTLNFLRNTGNWSDAMVYIDNFRNEFEYNTDPIKFIELYYLPKAQVLFNLNQPYAASKTLEECLAKNEKIPNDLHIILLNNLTDYYIELNQFNEAVILKQQLLSQFMIKDDIDFSIENRDNYIKLLGSLSNLYYKLDSIHIALEFANEQLNVISNYYPSNSKNYALSLHNFGTLLSITDDYEGAENALVKAVKLREKLFGIKSTEYLNSLTNLFILYDSHDNFEKADDIFFESYELHKELYNYQSKSLNTKEFTFLSLQLFKTFSYYFNYSLKRRENHPEQLEYMLNEYFSINNIGNKRMLRTTIKANNTKVYEDYLQAKIEYTNYLQLSEFRLHELGIDLDEKKDKLHQSERLLFQKFPYEFDESISLKNIAQGLQHDEQFVFCFTFFSPSFKKYSYATNKLVQEKGDKFYIFCSVTNSSEDYLKYYVVSNPEIYEDILISEYLTLTRSSSNDKEVSNSIKYISDFFNPIVNILDSSKKHLLFSPSEIMNSLTLDFMMNTKTGHYIVEDYIISYASPEAILDRETNTNYINQDAVLFGNPDFNFQNTQSISNNIEGVIGIKYNFKSVDNKSSLIILDVNRLGSAYKSGLRIGDEIIALNDKSITEFSNITEVSKEMKGPINSYVKFMVKTQSNNNDEKFILRMDPSVINRINLPLLPGTKKEIENLSTILANKGFSVKTFTEAQASEENLKNIKSPRILHIASHSFFIDPSSVDFNSNFIKNGIYQYRYAWNEGLFNGIYLSGVNNFFIENMKHGEDNGILFSKELENLDLTSTELVILSSCESGISTYGFFEGANGLVEAIRKSGAKNLISTLWKIDDDVTEEFISIFYSNYLNNLTISEALSIAKNQIRKKHPEPYYWAGFVHYTF